jgi:hypothetical protein
VAITEKVCGPSSSAAVVWGELQETGSSESTWQLKLEPLSEEVKAKVGVESPVSPSGPPVIWVCGGVVSGITSNVAVTERLVLIVTVHGPEPVHAPLQPANVEPGAAVALNETDVPAA